MSWNISDLDKSKTEQSIGNESIRLDNFKVILEKLERDYKHMCVEHENKELKLAEQIGKIKRSIKSGEKYINNCKEHLKDFENEEV